MATSTAVVVTLTAVSGAVAAVSVPNAEPQSPVAKSAPLEDSLFSPTPRRRPALIPAVAVTIRRAHPAPTIRLLPSEDGISRVALTAYRRAAQLANADTPSCGLPWQLVAAIGYIESDDGQIGGDSVSPAGDVTFPIEGLALDGTNGVARITDGRGHVVRAEGPLQFVPSTWAAWRLDANGDGRADPQNIFDASAGAARYLCSGGLDLSSVSGQAPAITSYNDSPIYVKNVENVERAYLAGRSAATVTLIPMATCPKPVPGSKVKAASARAPKAVPPGCPAAAVKKASKHKKATPVRVTVTHTVVVPAATPKPVAKPVVKPVPTPTPTPTTPAPSATPTPLPSSTATP